MHGSRSKLTIVLRFDYFISSVTAAVASVLYGTGIGEEEATVLLVCLGQSDSRAIPEKYSSRMMGGLDDDERLR